MSTTHNTPVRIKAEYGYYQGTYNAPQDGYLYNYKSDGKTDIMEFESIKAAVDYLTDKSHPESLFCDYDGDGQFSVSGTFVTNHGQHSRPRYTIVSAKSGRCTKAMIAECNELLNA